MNQRSSKDGPWCWASKDALQTIGSGFNKSAEVCAARSVYVALCQIASMEQAESFKASQAGIAKLAGVSDRTARKYLKSFQELGLVAYDVPSMKAVGIVTMLKLGRPEMVSQRAEMVSERPEPVSERSEMKVSVPFPPFKESEESKEGEPKTGTCFRTREGLIKSMKEAIHG